MYYDNKSTFYIKQYGPAVFTIVISLVLVLGGLYIYLSSNRNNKPQDTLVAKNSTQDVQLVEQNNNIEQTNSLQEVELNKEEEVKQEETKQAETNNESNANEANIININDIDITKVLSSELRALNKLEKSKEVTVLGIDDDKNIILNISDKNYKASLIGVDYKKSKSDIRDKINNDLANKKVTIAFDNVKIQNDTLCVYLYLDGNLYNKTLLSNGLAILNVEKANTSLLNDLVNAQKQAKTNSIGIWQK